MKTITLLLLVTLFTSFSIKKDTPGFGETFINNHRQIGFCDVNGVNIQNQTIILYSSDWENKASSLSNADFLLENGRLWATPSIVNNKQYSGDMVDLGKKMVLMTKEAGSKAIIDMDFPAFNGEPIGEGRYVNAQEGHLYFCRSRDDKAVLIEVLRIKGVGSNNAEMCMVELNWYLLKDTYKSELYIKLR
ncbi:MAG: hypothetical protein Q8M15_02120 [Bacteroidota bacterium]|nr:hypothetical protein [Bacteroidota bacterium]